MPVMAVEEACVDGELPVDEPHPVMNPTIRSTGTVPLCFINIDPIVPAEAGLYVRRTRRDLERKPLWKSGET